MLVIASHTMNVQSAEERRIISEFIKTTNKQKFQMATRTKSTETKTAGESKRPANYTPQQGSKAIFTLADIEDNLLFAELRRRNYTGELRFSKVISV